MIALAIRRRGILAPRISCDPDAVLSILISQRSRPGLHVDEPWFPVCISSHRLPLQYSPLLRDGRKGGGKCQTAISLLQWLADFLFFVFASLLSFLPLYSFITFYFTSYMKIWCLAPHTLLLLSPKITVNSTSCSYLPYSRKFHVSDFPPQVAVDPFLILCDDSCVVVKCSFQVTRLV